MAYGDRKRLDQLASVANLTDGDALPIDSRVEIVMGQSYPRLAAGQQWPMSNNALFYFTRGQDVRLSFLEQARIAQQQVDALQQQVLDQLLTGASATGKEVASLRALLELARAAQTAGDARQAAAEVRLAALEAKDTLLASASEANRLEIIKLQTADALLQARATNDETAIATAQATATQARAEAATAQKKADDDAAAVLALQAQLTTVQATATAAQQAAATNATALAGKLDASAVQRFTVATPAVSLVVGTPYAVPVLLPKAWANGNYLVFFTKASGSTLLNVQLSDTAKTGTGFNLTMQTTGLATLAVGASSAEVLVIQLAP